MNKRTKQQNYSPLIVICFLLAACGPATQPRPQPTAGLRPPAADQAIRPALPTAPLPAQPTNPAIPRATASVGREPATTLAGRLLFVRGGDLWLWQAGSGRRLTNAGDLSQPAWSPDGTQIVCVRRGQSVSDLLLLSADGSELRALTRNGRSSGDSFSRAASSIWAFYPAWAPDGSTLIYASQYGPPFGGPPAAEYRLVLYTMDASGERQRRQLYGVDEGHVSRAAYAPDGETIALSFTPVGTDAPQILRYRPDGEVVPMPGVPAESYDPAYAPDGGWLAFAAREGTTTDLFAVPAAGGAALRLTNLGAARAPTWSPDGRQIAFLALAPGERRFDLWVVDVSVENGSLRAGTPRRLTEGAAIDADSGVSWAR